MGTQEIKIKPASNGFIVETISIESSPFSSSLHETKKEFIFTDLNQALTFVGGKLGDMK